MNIVKRLLTKVRPLATDEIEAIMNYSNNPTFIGVFAIDTLPQKIQPNQSMIINLNTSKQSGSHWVTVYCGNRYCEYFDSFGIIPPPEIRKMCYTSGLPCVYSTNSIQNLNSILCGYFSIYYILMRSQGIDMYDIIYEFDIDNEKQNDKLVMNGLKKILL